jgi:hypothetical protein
MGTPTQFIFVILTILFGTTFVIAIGLNVFLGFFLSLLLSNAAVIAFMGGFQSGGGAFVMAVGWGTLYMLPASLGVCFATFVGWMIYKMRRLNREEFEETSLKSSSIKKD